MEARHASRPDADSIQPGGLQPQQQAAPAVAGSGGARRDHDILRRLGPGQWHLQPTLSTKFGTGAGQVLAPFWPVDDTSTLRIIAGSYEALAADEGADLAALLHDSARDLRDNAPAATVTPVKPPSRSFLQRLFGREELGGAASATVFAQTRGLQARVAPWVDRSHPHYWAAFAVHGLPDRVG